MKTWVECLVPGTLVTFLGISDGCPLWSIPIAIVGFTTGIFIIAKLVKACEKVW